MVGSTDGGSLRGKRLLITGAATGIGAALSRLAVERGASVVLVDINDQVEQLAEEVGGHAHVADVSKSESAAEIVPKAVEQLGGLDALANVAGVHRKGAVADATDEEWDLVMGVNLNAPMYWSRAALPVLVEGGGGAIVNVASIASTHAIPESAAYIASKTGLLGLTRSIACDYGRQGVRCNAVCPGSVETEFIKAYMERNKIPVDSLLDANFLGRMGSTEEVAALCAYLLSDESGFVTAASFAIDGGRSVKA
jgi:NAD(P)-dependent dehydrogenase (short-subunit alcohol dehydrogenase family)